MAFKERELLVDGDYLSLVRRQVVKVVRTDSFLNTLSNRAYPRSDILPPGCKLYSNKGSLSTYVMEKTPGITAIRYYGIPYILSLPFLQFWLNFNIQPSSGEAVLMTYRITCTTKPLASMEDTVYSPPLLNTYVSGIVCMGTAAVKGTTVFQISQSFVSAITGRDHNDDLHPAFPEEIRKSSNKETLTQWAKLTKSNPLVGLTFTYNPLTSAHNFLGGLEANAR